MESIALLISQLFPPHTITEKHATYIYNCGSLQLLRGKAWNQ